MPNFKVTVSRHGKPDTTRTIRAGHASTALAEATSRGDSKATVQQVDDQGRGVGRSRTYRNG